MEGEGDMSVQQRYPSGQTEQVRGGAEGEGDMSVQLQQHYPSGQTEKLTGWGGS